MVNRAFQLILLLSPITTGTDINMDMFDIVFFRTGVIALFAASLLDRPRREIPKNMAYAIFGLLVLSVWSLFVHNFSSHVLHTTFNLFLAIIAFSTVYIYWDTNKSLRKYILLAGLFNLIFYCSQKVGFDPIWDQVPYKGQEGAFLGNQPRLMTYFALITPLLPLWLLPISFALGIFTKQSVIFVPIVVVLFARMKSIRERIGFGMVIFLSAILLWNNLRDSLMFRFNTAWRQALVVFFNQPLVGIGIGVRPLPELDAIGNSYLQFMVGAGILGAVWFGYVFRELYKILFVKAGAALLSLSLILAIEYVLELPRLWYLTIAIIIITLVPVKEKKWS